MSKKILLRRPRYFPKEYVNNTSTVDETEDIFNTFKNDIQLEIDAIERECSYFLDESLCKNREFDQNFVQHNNSITASSRNFDCPIISSYDIKKGLKPLKFEILPKLTEKCSSSKFSKKTVKEYEKLASFFKSEKYLFNQNLYQQIEGQLPSSNQPIPKHILFIQLAALLNYQLAEDYNPDKVSCAIRTLPKIHSESSQPKYEVILFEKEDIRDLNPITSNKISNILQRNIINNNLPENQLHQNLANSCDSQKHVMEDEADPEISPEIISLMECWMNGKINLNLAAHSISKIPNLLNNFPYLNTLDLSYNHFKVIPKEIFQLEHLNLLNLKSNPLQLLNETVCKLTSLRVLICSFTLISTIPNGLFRCENLEQVDLSYNKIQFVPHLEGSSKLKVLNLSGNPIRYFKKSFGKLNLQNLGLENTWISPVFWKEGEFELSDVESSWAYCDLCDQGIRDFSFNSIAFSRKFNHTLPILLSFCSVLCRDSF